MSQYTVEHRPITELDVYLAADILYAFHPLVRAQPWPLYRDLLIKETVGEQGVVCYCNGRFAGAIVIGELDYDSHFPGKGIIVYYSVTHPDHPKATRLLYRYLVQLVKDGGGSWYQTGRRISEFEFHSKYRRIALEQEDQKSRSQV